MVGLIWGLWVGGEDGVCCDLGLLYVCDLWVRVGVVGNGVGRGGDGGCGEWGRDVGFGVVVY